VKFPHTVTRLRADGLDEYGDAGAWTSPSSKAVSVFVIEKISSTVNGSSLSLSFLCPASADVLTGDRIVWQGVTYLATRSTISSPSKAVLGQVALSALPAS
jgi:hypothetical protein